MAKITFADIAAKSKANAVHSHNVGKSYVMFVTDKFGQLIGLEKDATAEGVKAKLAKYGKLAAYYTVYAVVAVPAYLSGFLVAGIAGLFGKKIDLAKAKEEVVKAGGTVHTDGAVEYYENL